MKTRNVLVAACFVALAGCAAVAPSGGKRELMIIGNDEKVTWDDTGKLVLRAPGNDSVSIVDIGTDPLAPRIIANLPLMNSIFGPPTNLAITPDESLALVATREVGAARRSECDVP